MSFLGGGTPALKHCMRELLEALGEMAQIWAGQLWPSRVHPLGGGRGGAVSLNRLRDTQMGARSCSWGGASMSPV